MACPRVQRLSRAVVVEEEQGVVVDDGRELEQRIVFVAPANVERRFGHVRSVEHAGAGGIEAVARPQERIDRLALRSGRRGRRRRREREVRVRDVAGLMQQDERDGAPGKHKQDGADDQSPPQRAPRTGACAGTHTAFDAS